MLPVLPACQSGLAGVDVEQHCRQGAPAERCTSLAWGLAMSRGPGHPMGARAVTFWEAAGVTRTTLLAPGVPCGSLAMLPTEPLQVPWR